MRKRCSTTCCSGWFKVTRPSQYWYKVNRVRGIQSMRFEPDSPGWHGSSRMSKNALIRANPPKSARNLYSKTLPSSCVIRGTRLSLTLPDCEVASTGAVSVPLTKNPCPAISEPSSSGAEPLKNARAESSPQCSPTSANFSKP